MKFGPAPLNESIGAIVAHAVRIDGLVLKKGEIVEAAHVPLEGSDIRALEKIHGTAAKGLAGVFRRQRVRERDAQRAAKHIVLGDRGVIKGQRGAGGDRGDGSDGQRLRVEDDSGDGRG